MREMESLPFESKLKELILFSLEKQRLTRELITIQRYIGEREIHIHITDREELFNLRDNVNTRTNGYQPTVNKLKLEIRWLLTIRVLKF